MLLFIIFLFIIRNELPSQLLEQMKLDSAPLKALFLHSSPLLLVPKKDDILKIVVDFCALMSGTV